MPGRTLSEVVNSTLITRLKLSCGHRKDLNRIASRIPRTVHCAICQGFANQPIRPVLTFPCDYCGAAPGDPCTGAPGSALWGPRGPFRRRERPRSYPQPGPGHTTDRGYSHVPLTGTQMSP